MKKIAIVITILYISVIAFGGHKLAVALTHPIKYREEIILSSTKYNLNPALVASVINVESSYKTNAVSPKNAVGLMQLKQSTVQYLIDYYKLNVEIENLCLTDAKTNIEFGCMYINYLNNKFSDSYTALSAYNAGETRTRVWLKDPNYSKDSIHLDYIPYKETENYIKKIKQNLKFYSKYF